MSAFWDLVTFIHAQTICVHSLAFNAPFSICMSYMVSPTEVVISVWQLVHCNFICVTGKCKIRTNMPWKSGFDNRRVGKMNVLTSDHWGFRNSMWVSDSQLSLCIVCLSWGPCWCLWNSSADGNLKFVNHYKAVWLRFPQILWSTSTKYPKRCPIRPL